MKNEVQLITYVDRIAKDLPGLNALLREKLANLFGGIHLLPFFDRIDGADAGFDPTDHTCVDPRLGGWSDIRELASQADVMADVIVNHMSSASPQFLDFSKHGAESRYDGLFLTYDAVFPSGATERELTEVYRPRPGLPFTVKSLCGGDRRILWTTFTPDQIDINVEHPAGRAYLSQILHTFAANGVRMVRLDAAGYAIKRAGTSCFMIPETFEFIERFAAEARALGIEVLVEIHSHYQRQIEIAKRVDWVYDFALPPLVLHAFAYGTVARLKEWIDIRPTNALTVLDTHDGIGVIDVGADTSTRPSRPGLVPDRELDHLVEVIHEQSNGQSRRATGAAASNLDVYQVNCTFYDALGRCDRSYLISRAVQFFLPGIPQVYYAGLFAEHNDMELLAKTGVGRDINRHYYLEAEIEAAMQRTVVKDLMTLIRLRNRHPAFSGRFECVKASGAALHLRWESGSSAIDLQASFADRSLVIRPVSNGLKEDVVLDTFKV